MGESLVKWELLLTKDRIVTSKLDQNSYLRSYLLFADNHLPK